MALLFFVVIWSVWGIRNKIIFQNGEANWNGFVEVLKNRWLSWAVEWLQDGRSKNVAPVAGNDSNGSRTTSGVVRITGVFCYMKGKRGL